MSTDKMHLKSKAVANRKIRDRVSTQHRGKPIASSGRESRAGISSRTQPKDEAARSQPNIGRLEEKVNMMV
jgi:hypothetical protein